MRGCQYPNVCYGPAHFDVPTPMGAWVSVRPVEESLSGFGVQPLPKATTGVILGALLGVGLVIAIAVVALQE